MTVKKFHEFYQNVLSAQNRFLSESKATVKLEVENDYEEMSYADACEWQPLNNNNSINKT